MELVIDENVKENTLELRMKLLRLGIMMNSEQIENEQYPCDKCE